jgi:hypothetical protein
MTYSIYGSSQLISIVCRREPGVSWDRHETQENAEFASFDSLLSSRRMISDMVLAAVEAKAALGNVSYFQGVKYQ